MRREAPGQWAVAAQLGTNITVTEPLRLLAEEQPGLTLPFRRCMPRGCFAELEAPEDEIATMARRAEAGRLDWRDAEGNALSIPLSLRGLAPALAALRGA